MLGKGTQTKEGKCTERMYKADTTERLHADTQILAHTHVDTGFGGWEPKIGGGAQEIGGRAHKISGGAPKVDGGVQEMCGAPIYGKRNATDEMDEKKCWEEACSVRKEEREKCVKRQVMINKMQRISQ